MTRKLGLGAASVTCAAFVAFLLLGPRAAQSGDTRAGDLSSRVHEIESLQKDLELVEALNKLHLSREQLQALLDAARKVDALKQKFASQHGKDLEQAAETMKELRTSMNKGTEDSDLREEAELLKHRFDRFQKKLDSELDPILDSVLAALKDVRAGEAPGDLLQQADAVEKIQQAMDEMRIMTDEDYANKIDPGIDQHIDKLGIQDESARAKEHARLREIADKVRTMPQEEYESKSHDLAEEILTKGETGERVAQAKKGGLPKDARAKVKEVLLRDSTVQILEERLSATK